MKKTALVLLLAISMLVFVAPAVAQTFDCPGSTFVGDSGEQVINPSAGSAACLVETTGGTVTLTGTLDPVASIGSSETLATSESGHFLSLYDSAGSTVDLGTLPGSLASVTDPNGNQTSYTYDSAGRVIAETEFGMTVTYAYDSAGRVTSETNASGMTQFTYDTSGDLIKETDPLGNVTTYAYDTSGDLLTETDPLGKVTTYTYDTRGDLLTETDPLGKVTTYTYDGLGRVIDVIDPITPNGTTSFAYTPEPASMVLFGTGLLAIGFIMRKRVFA